MVLINEEAYFYYISLRTEYVKFDDYKEWLNKVFLADDTNDDTLLELQSCTGSIEKTIDTLNIYLFDKSELLNFQEIGKMIINELKRQQDNDSVSLKELTHKLYDVWTLLPSEIASIEPFIKMNSIDDSWSWGDEKQILETISWLFSYYD